ncbi:hypothetical protein ACTXG7_24840 [Mycolicibacterium sp. Dal123E01]|uniref:hypothetical protein n=1 Tax=Mycolicibacterium sp. Dal123E01 TaxID=3457578 RepID=UPI00403E3E6D
MDDGNQAVESSESAQVARWAGAFGVAVPALGIVAYPIWSYPATQAPGADVARWAAANHDRLVLSQSLFTVGVVLWLVFGAAVSVHIRRRLPPASVLAPIFSAGFIAMVTLILSGFTAFNLLLYRDRGPESSTLLYDLTFGLLAMSGLLAAVALGAFAIAVYRHRVLPLSTAHVGIVAAAAHLFLIVGFIAHDGPLSLEGFLVTWGIPILLFAWILRTALAMPRNPR